MTALGLTGTAIVLEDGTLVARETDATQWTLVGDASTKFVDIATSAVGGHYAAVSTDGCLTVWGKNVDGAQGAGFPPSVYSSLPVKIPRLLFGGSRVFQVAVGNSHTVVLTTTGRVYTSGQGRKGALGHGIGSFGNYDEMLEIWPFIGKCASFVAAGAESTFVVCQCEGEQRNSLWACGSCEHGGLGLETRSPCYKLTRLPTFGSSNIKMLSSYRHTVAVQDDGEAYVWGLNDQGQLGVGDTQNRRHPTMLRHPYLRIVSVACGHEHTTILDKTRQVYTCGRGDLGALGHGDTVNTKFFTRVTNMPPAKAVSANATRSAAVAANGNDNGKLFVWGCISSPQIKGPVVSTPTLVPTAAGVCRYGNRIDPLYVLAFAMGTHSRIGAASAMNALPEDLIRRVLDKCHAHGPPGPSRILASTFDDESTPLRT